LLEFLPRALTVAPFLAGRDSHSDRQLAAVWIGTIVTNAVVGISAGTRSGLMAAVLFGAGYVSALPKSRRLIAGAFAGLAIVPLLEFSGAAGIVRSELGRGFERVKPEHVREVFDGIVRQMGERRGENFGDIAVEGVGRLLAWTNVVVPIMTPETIPYRGFDGFLSEMIQTFHIARLSGTTADDFYDLGLGTAPASEYGFTVNANSSVEMTLAADGWSKGGAPGALLFAVIATLAMTLAEAFVHWLLSHRSGPSTILELPIAYAAFLLANVMPLLAMLRTMAMDLFAVCVLVVIVETVRFVSTSVGRCSRGGVASTRFRAGRHRTHDALPPSELIRLIAS
jgi:hypothetical protein